MGALAEPAPSDVTDGEGVFVLTGEVSGAAFGLVAEAPRMSPSDIRVAAVGERDIVLVVSAGASIELRLRLPAGLGSGAIDVELEAKRSRTPLFPSGEPQRAGTRSIELAYAAHDLAAGPTSLVVRSTATEQEILRLDTSLRAGESVDLGVHDLSAALDTIEVWVMDEHGAHLSDARLFVIAGSDRRWVSSGGPSPTRVPRPPPDASIEAHSFGYVSARARVDGDRMEFRLARSRPVTMRLPHDHPAPAEGTSVLVSIHFPGGVTSITTIGPSKRLSFQYAGPGTYGFSPVAPASQGYEEIDPAARSTLELDEGAIDAEIELPVPLDVWMRALERHGAGAK
jgi:hypothetical protein